MWSIVTSLIIKLIPAVLVAMFYNKCYTENIDISFKNKFICLFICILASLFSLLSSYSFSLPPCSVPIPSSTPPPFLFWKGQFFHENCESNKGYQVEVRLSTFHVLGQGWMRSGVEKVSRRIRDSPAPDVKSFTRGYNYTALTYRLNA